MVLTKQEQALVASAKRHGIAAAEVAYEVWKATKAKPLGFDYALLCAFLMKETSGGHNVFGHDPTIAVGWGTVTHPKYERYLVLRAHTHKYQGVGPLQLTYGGYQDQADMLGGCWRPRFNITVGCGIIAGHIRQYGLAAGIAAYNGTGAAAIAYARAVLQIRASFEHMLTADELKPELIAPVTFNAAEVQQVLARVTLDADYHAR